MIVDTKEAIKAAGVGIAGAILMVIVNGFKYLFQDVLPEIINLNPGNDLFGLASLFTYFLSIAAGLAVGCGAVWVLRNGPMSIRSAVVYAAVAGIALGVVGFFFQVVYDLVFRPFIVGYAYSALDALITIAYCGIDIGVMAGLAIAGGALYTVFIIRPDAVQVVSQPNVKH